MSGRKILLIVLMILCIALLSHCSRDKNDPVGNDEEQVSEGDAVSAVALSLSPESSCLGINGFLSSPSLAKRNLALLERVPSQILYDTTVNFSYNFPPYSYSKKNNFTLKFVKRGKEWNYLLPRTDTVIIRINSKGVFDTPRLDGSDTSFTTQLFIWGLLDSSSYKLRGEYNWKGRIISNEKKGLEFNLTYKMQFFDLVILKNSRDIVSGTADITISGESVKGKSFSYSGIITFLPGSEAVMKIGSNTFTIDLENGDILN